MIRQSSPNSIARRAGAQPAGASAPPPRSRRRTASRIGQDIQLDRVSGSSWRRRRITSAASRGSLSRFRQAARLLPASKKARLAGRDRNRGPGRSFGRASSPSSYARPRWARAKARSPSTRAISPSSLWASGRSLHPARSHRNSSTATSTAWSMARTSSTSAARRRLLCLKAHLTDLGNPLPGAVQGEVRLPSDDFFDALAGIAVLPAVDSHVQRIPVRPLTCLREPIPVTGRSW